MGIFEGAFQEKQLGHSSLLLKNVFIRSAAYEGMFDQGIPNQKLLDHHVAMARGEVALTTVSYGAVSAGGRTFNNQMYIHDRSLEKLKILAEEVRYPRLVGQEIRRLIERNGTEGAVYFYGYSQSKNHYFG